jgi:ABC-type glycerol-3-phosphate transport system substrate-binding protein
MLERAKNAAFAVVVATLFVAGLLRYGIPPGRPAAQTAPADTTSNAPNAAAGTVAITHSNGPAEDDKPAQAERRLVAEFYHRKFPDAELRFSTWQFSPDTFFAKAIAGTLPEIVGVFATESTIILDSRMSSDITDELKAWKLYPLLNPRLVEPMSRGGRVYGLPVGGANGGFYVMTLFYNKDLLRAAGLVDAAGEIIAPQTWDDFTTYAARLTDRKRGVAGFGILGETGGCAWHFLNWAWQAGGDFERQDPQTGAWRAVFDEPPVVRALEFLKDLRWKHDVLQRNVLAGNDEIQQGFASGRVAMCLQAPETIQSLVHKFHMPAERIGICLLPAGPAGRANQIGGAFVLLRPGLEGKRKQRAFDSIVFEHDLDVVDAKIKLLAAQGRPIGIPTVPTFTPEYQARLDAIVNRHRNVPDQGALMAEASGHIRMEPPVKAQVLYEYLSAPIQEVLVEPAANPAADLRAANRRFQLRVLDPVNEKGRDRGRRKEEGRRMKNDEAARRGSSRMATARSSFRVHS